MKREWESRLLLRCSSKIAGQGALALGVTPEWHSVYGLTLAALDCNDWCRKFGSCAKTSAKGFILDGSPTSDPPFTLSGSQKRIANMMHRDRMQTLLIIGFSRIIWRGSTAPVYFGLTGRSNGCLWTRLKFGFLNTGSVTSFTFCAAFSSTFNGFLNTVDCSQYSLL